MGRTLLKNTNNICYRWKNNFTPSLWKKEDFTRKRGGLVIAGLYIERNTWAALYWKLSQHKDGLGNPGSHKTLFSSQSHHLRSLFLRMMCRANRAEKLYEKDIILILSRYICVIQGLYYLQLLFLRRSFVEMRNNYISSLLFKCFVFFVYLCFCIWAIFTSYWREREWPVESTEIDSNVPNLFRYPFLHNK